MRSIVVAANWKMNKKASEVPAFFEEFCTRIQHHSVRPHMSLEVIFAVPAPLIEAAQRVMSDQYRDQMRKLGMSIAAQNLSEHEQGAYTGEVSASMLTDLQVRCSIIGHSERRQHYGETDHHVAQKTVRALEHKMHPIVCVGESLEHRENGQTESVIARQLEALFDVMPEWQRVTIAYEPVWAIGTGVSASVDQAQTVHGFIRDQIARRYDRAAGERTSIIYGGSVKPASIGGLICQKDIDGVLVGGASLQPSDFAAIVENTIQS